MQIDRFIRGCTYEGACNYVERQLLIAAIVTLVALW